MGQEKTIAKISRSCDKANCLLFIYDSLPLSSRFQTLYELNAYNITSPITLCTRDTINYLTSETDTTRRGAWRKMESGELMIILILQAFMRGSLGQELAEK